MSAAGPRAAYASAAAVPAATSAATVTVCPRRSGFGPRLAGHPTRAAYSAGTTITGVTAGGARSPAGHSGLADVTTPARAADTAGPTNSTGATVAGDDAPHTARASGSSRTTDKPCRTRISWTVSRAAGCSDTPAPAGPT